MSIQSVTDLAADRDAFAPGTPTAGYGQALTKGIPTESLAAYTAFSGLVQTQATATDPLVGWRWGALIGFMLLTIIAVVSLYRRKSAQRKPKEWDDDKERFTKFVPYETLPVLLAAALWGTAMPGGPLDAQLRGATGALVTGALIIGGGALYMTAAAPLRTANSTKGTETIVSPSPPVGGPQPPHIGTATTTT